MYYILLRYYNIAHIPKSRTDILHTAAVSLPFVPRGFMCVCVHCAVNGRKPENSSIRKHYASGRRRKFAILFRPHDDDETKRRNGLEVSKETRALLLGDALHTQAQRQHTEQQTYGLYGVKCIEMVTP